MAAGRYNTACAEEVLRAKGVDVTAVNACMGPSNTDTTHPLMEVCWQGRRMLNPPRIFELPSNSARSARRKGSNASMQWC
jgi:hypothetical protein